jgi:hypothetical protein
VARTGVTAVWPLMQTMALIAGFVELALLGSVTNQIVTGQRSI